MTSCLPGYAGGKTTPRSLEPTQPPSPLPGGVARESTWTLSTSREEAHTRHRTLGCDVPEPILAAALISYAVLLTATVVCFLKGRTDIARVGVVGAMVPPLAALLIVTGDSLIDFEDNEEEGWVVGLLVVLPISLLTAAVFLRALGATIWSALRSAMVASWWDSSPLGLRLLVLLPGLAMVVVFGSPLLFEEFGNGSPTVGTVISDITEPAPSGSSGIELADDAFSTDEDSILRVPPPGVLSNDSDLDDDPLKVTGHHEFSAAGARVDVSTDGAVIYDPRAASRLDGLEQGDLFEDTFRYRASDGTTHRWAVVEVTVAGQSDP